MRMAGLVAATGLVSLAAACGRNEGQNVMVPQATPLTQAQVDRALGPEPQGPAIAVGQDDGEAPTRPAPASEAPAGEAPTVSRPAPPPAESAGEQDEPPPGAEQASEDGNAE